MAPCASLAPLASSSARCVLVEDDDGVAADLAVLLRRAGASTVTRWRASALATAELAGCDLLVLGPDLEVPAGRVLAGLLDRGLRGRIVVLVPALDPVELVALLRLGVDAVAPVPLDQDTIDELLQRVVAGERSFDRVAFEAVRPALAVRPGSAPLSPREREVLELLASRRTFAEIAADLFVSTGTIKRHSASIYAKLGVRSRAEAVERAFSRRLLDAVV